MKPIERIQALLSGKKLDTPAINLWKHFPPYDEEPSQLIKKNHPVSGTFRLGFCEGHLSGPFFPFRTGGFGDPVA